MTGVRDRSCPGGAVVARQRTDRGVIAGTYPLAGARSGAGETGKQRQPHTLSYSNNPTCPQPTRRSSSPSLVRTQRTVGILNLDVSEFDGLVLAVAEADADKRFTLTLKDEVLPKRDDGRDQSSISWEYDFTATPGRDVVIRWSDLKPTYRGRPKPDAKPLDTAGIKRVSFMMRRYVSHHSTAMQCSRFLVCLTLMCGVMQFLWRPAGRLQPRDSSRRRLFWTARDFDDGGIHPQGIE